MRLDVYFDFSCPYAYIGTTQVEALAERTGAQLRWKPMLLGGVFRSSGAGDGPMHTMPPSKARHNALDMHRWADHYGVPLKMPAGHPMRTVRALRALLTLDEARWPAAIHALYRAYWVDGRRIYEPEVIGEVLRGAGFGAAEIETALAANDDQAIKDQLRARTDEAVARGVFGAPTMYVGDGDELMFWGQDRLGFTEDALNGWRPEVPTEGGPAIAEGTSAGDGPELELWYDFSSPFAYLGATQIEAVAARTGARLRWRPMLLGAVFKEIGTPNVPMLAVNANKQRYYSRELTYWASHWGVPFRFTSRFPMKTVTALRLALLAGDDKIAPLSHALYRALWVEDRDLNDPSTLIEILEANGLPASLLERTREPAVKQWLIDNTSEAIAAGVFGAPTCIVKDPEGDMLLWGQDRLGLVERVLNGWRPKSR